MEDELSVACRKTAVVGKKRVWLDQMFLAALVDVFVAFLPTDENKRSTREGIPRFASCSCFHEHLSSRPCRSTDPCRCDYARVLLREDADAATHGLEGHYGFLAKCLHEPFANIITANRPDVSICMLAIGDEEMRRNVFQADQPDELLRGTKSLSSRLRRNQTDRQRRFRKCLSGEVANRRSDLCSQESPPSKV